MSDKDIPSSGSRWEPANGAPGSSVPQPEPTPAGTPMPAADDAATEHPVTHGGDDRDADDGGTA